MAISAVGSVSLSGNSVSGSDKVKSRIISHKAQLKDRAVVLEGYPDNFYGNTDSAQAIIPESISKVMYSVSDTLGVIFKGAVAGLFTLVIMGGLTLLSKCRR